MSLLIRFNCRMLNPRVRTNVPAMLASRPSEHADVSRGIKTSLSARKLTLACASSRPFLPEIRADSLAREEASCGGDDGEFPAKTAECPVADNPFLRSSFPPVPTVSPLPRGTLARYNNTPARRVPRNASSYVFRVVLFPTPRP